MNELLGSEQGDRLSEEEIRFKELSSKWKRETMFLSSITRMVEHPAYQEIIGMGEVAIPFMLRELEKGPDHWFVALYEITGLDVAVGTETMDDASKRWIDWGQKNGYIPNESEQK